MVQARLSPRSLEDRDRLLAFLVELSPTAAERAMAVLSGALRDMGEFPRHRQAGTARIPSPGGPFWPGGYQVRYRIYLDRVFLTRIFHTRENR